MSTVWEDAYDCVKQYRCSLAIHLMTVLSSLYGITMYHSINSPVRGKNLVDGLNATVKRYLKEQMELIGKLASNDTSNIGILTSAS